MKGSRTKNANTIQEGTLIATVDIGMISNHGCCAAADGRNRKYSHSQKPSRVHAGTNSRSDIDWRSGLIFYT